MCQKKQKKEKPWKQKGPLENFESSLKMQHTLQNVIYQADYKLPISLLHFNYRREKRGIKIFTVKQF